VRIAVALEQEEHHQEQARTEEGDEGGWSWSMHDDEESCWLSARVVAQKKVPASERL